MRAKPSQFIGHEMLCRLVPGWVEFLPIAVKTYVAALVLTAQRILAHHTQETLPVEFKSLPFALHASSCRMIKIDCADCRSKTNPKTWSRLASKADALIISSRSDFRGSRNEFSLKGNKAAALEVSS